VVKKSTSKKRNQVDLLVVVEEAGHLEIAGNLVHLVVEVR
jgi:hypothetical protein